MIALAGSSEWHAVCGVTLQTWFVSRDYVRTRYLVRNRALLDSNMLTLYPAPKAPQHFREIVLQPWPLPQEASIRAALRAPEPL